LANLLCKRLGLSKGDRVSILAHNNVVYLDLLFGVGKIGAVFVPLNWRLAREELVYILKHCQPKALFFGPEFSHMISPLKQALDIPHIVLLEGTRLEGTISYEYELAQVSADEPKRPPLYAEDPYCILYTSGTTGRPKGAVLPHRQILWNCINTVVSWGLSGDDVSPVYLPLFHVGGLFAFLTPLFYIGGRIVLTRGFDAEQSLRLIQRERCTVILGVPSVFRIWQDTDAYSEVDFSHVRWFISGGAPCPVRLMKTWRKSKGVVFRQGYGLTEVGPNCFSMSNEESVTKCGSVGKSIIHTQVRIVDENDSDVPLGQIGELAISGPHLSSGYWRNEAATAQAIRDGWFCTGDMAKMDADGYVYVVGRFKDMIISGGENIYAAEVESVFLDHPDVTEAALIGQPDERFGEVGLMVVVLREGSAVKTQELLNACEGRLARYKVPKHVVISNALPYSSYGKIQKSELRKRYHIKNEPGTR
jgi:fatty-acyl-CoA synthase